MAIPDFQSIMLPLLRKFQDNQFHRVRDFMEPLADEFQLTVAERAELLPSGRQALFRNRVGWAVSHMYHAGLIERVGHGQYQISQRGKNTLAENLPRIDLNYLNQYEEHREFRSGKPTASKPQTPETTPVPDESTPRESLEASYYELRKSLADEVLEEAKSISPSKFEQLVVDLLVAMGYGGSESDAARAVGRSGDEGIDGIINEDKLGLDTIYIQAKRWENVVGQAEVRGFAGSLEGQRARKGVMITTSKFTNSAHQFVDRIEKKIILIDGEQLAQHMIDHGIGVSEVQTYSVYRIDSDYFVEE